MSVNVPVLPSISEVPTSKVEPLTTEKLIVFEMVPPDLEYVWVAPPLKFIIPVELLVSVNVPPDCIQFPETLIIIVFPVLLERFNIPEVNEKFPLILRV